MIEHILTRKQHSDIFDYAFSTNQGPTVYLRETFHGTLDFKMHAAVTDHDFWGSVTFESEEYLTWFLLRWS
jgi:hypothetical protein